jgi:hypothetical protein
MKKSTEIIGASEGYPDIRPVWAVEAVEWRMGRRGFGDAVFDVSSRYLGTQT